MAVLYSDIRAALESHLSATVGMPSIAYENVSFSPQTGSSYVEVSLIPTSRRPAVRGLNPQQRYQGVFAINCYAPEGKGPAAADDLANLVISAFEATSSISFTNAEEEIIIVSIDYAERQQGFLDTPFYYVPVNIGWYIYAN
jgi:hypothetical protein